MTLARVRAVAPAPAPAPAREAERQPGRGQAEVECVGVGRAGGLGLCMPSLDVVRFATPFLPANWQLSTLRGACPVTGAHVHTTRLDDRSKFNANTEFQLSRCCVPLPSVRVCARRTCLIAQFMGGAACHKVQTANRYRPHPTPNKQLRIAERDLCAIFDMHFQFSSSFKGVAIASNNEFHWLRLRRSKAQQEQAETQRKQQQVK